MKESNLYAAPAEVIEGLKEFDSATVFNAVVESIGGSQGGLELEGKGGVPENYTGPGIRCLLPELGAVVGYAVTSEVTTNDPDSEPASWEDYYDLLDKTPSPIVAVMKDVDSRPGRGASFGDGMAVLHRILGATGAIVDGSVRDIAGIREAGLPMWGSGLVPGHGVFHILRMQSSVTVAGLRILPGELLIADEDGCTKIPKATTRPSYSRRRGTSGPGSRRTGSSSPARPSASRSGGGAGERASS